ncbi:oxidoreductase [Durotheca rogersii]|uniref:oxidoreductase n=1 Tax=Durotheca rogersii TaxID=419775 RepID=UPI00221F6243|nr:oxidoreductase [Durotheca rogersii]KAI5866949.1 oxidoreductase [Durotheca rogersii]
MPRTLTIKKVDGKPGQVYYPLQLNEVPRPVPGPKEVLVRLHAAALNHRDLFIRQQLYPGISFEQPLLADGVGTVVEAGADVDPAVARSLLRARVLLTPSRGWAADPRGPEDPNPASFSVVGGSALLPPGSGTAQDYALLDPAELEPAPPHLTAAEAAALPLVGLTAWRALVTKGLGAPDADAAAAAADGINVLVTGIGGGVALSALQFAVALGARVFVTSGDPAKLERARRELGAAGGVSYRDAAWDKQLAAQLPASRPYLDLVIDGAGGDVVSRAVRLLRPGGVISVYGMTVAPKMDWTMQAVLRNVDLRGSTMGSRAEFRAMVDFVRRHTIHPIVSRVVRGLDDIAAIDGLFEDIRAGRQFGKLVIEISPEGEDSAKL